MGIWIPPSLRYQGSDARALLTWVGRLRVPDSALTRVIWLVIREAVKAIYGIHTMPTKPECVNSFT